MNVATRLGLYGGALVLVGAAGQGLGAWIGPGEPPEHEHLPGHALSVQRPAAVAVNGGAPGDGAGSTAFDEPRTRIRSVSVFREIAGTNPGPTTARTPDRWKGIER